MRVGKIYIIHSGICSRCVHRGSGACSLGTGLQVYLYFVQQLLLVYESYYTTISGLYNTSAYSDLAFVTSVQYVQYHLNRQLVIA